MATMTAKDIFEAFVADEFAEIGIDLRPRLKELETEDPCVDGENGGMCPECESTMMYAECQYALVESAELQHATGVNEDGYGYNLVDAPTSDTFEVVRLVNDTMNVTVKADYTFDVSED